MEDDYIREKALGGADTASRAQIVWQVKVFKSKEVPVHYNTFLGEVPSFREEGQKPKLKARARKASEDDKNPSDHAGSKLPGC